MGDPRFSLANTQMILVACWRIIDYTTYDIYNH